MEIYVDTYDYTPNPNGFTEYDSAMLRTMAAARYAAYESEDSSWYMRENLDAICAGIENVVLDFNADIALAADHAEEIETILIQNCGNFPAERRTY